MPRQPPHARRWLISGRVQGVGYRWWTVRTADRLGLDGWVRNLGDGSVEVLAIGAPEAVERLAAACGAGPAAARVSALERHPAEDDGSTGFTEWPSRR